ncbi:MAG: HD-GYP domain-containing protein [Lachnospira sp.]
MKKVPIRILVIVLAVGIVSTAGEYILSHYMNNLVEEHKTIMKEYVRNGEYTKEISVLLYRHHAIIGHILTDDGHTLESYEEQEMQIRSEIKELLIEFSDRMSPGEYEQLFHVMYSNYCSYEKNVSKLLGFCDEGSYDTALYYYNEVLTNFLTEIDTNLDALDEYTQHEIHVAQLEMDENIDNAQVVQAICVLTVALLSAFSVYYCVKITKGLDDYKSYLENELKQKQEDLVNSNRKVIKLQNGIIIGMANLIESRDATTGEHVKKTSIYVKMIAEAARKKGIYADELTDGYIDRLTKAAPLHDVGKIIVPDSILMKPGKLTPEEFSIMKNHSKEGGNVIRAIFENLEDKEYVDMAVDIAQYHHEKWDGSGYMEGLRGTDIPLSARIMAIADVFDALISKRCYKEAFPIDEAFNIIKESAGTHFDPKLADVFLEIRGEIEKCLR